MGFPLAVETNIALVKADITALIDACVVAHDAIDPEERASHAITDFWPVCQGVLTNYVRGKQFARSSDGGAFIPIGSATMPALVGTALATVGAQIDDLYDECAATPGLATSLTNTWSPAMREVLEALLETR